MDLKQIAKTDKDLYEKILKKILEDKTISEDYKDKLKKDFLRRIESITGA